MSDDTTDTPETTITFRREHGRRTPAINIKVYLYDEALRAALQQYVDSDPEIDRAFDMDWIEGNLSDEDRSFWWDAACTDGYEDGKQLVTETLGEKGYQVDVSQAGRSGGWMVVEGLPDYVEEWSPELVSEWAELATSVRRIADDVPFTYLTLIYTNVFMAKKEEAFNAWRTAGATRYTVVTGTLTTGITLTGEFTDTRRANQHAATMPGSHTVMPILPAIETIEMQDVTPLDGIDTDKLAVALGAADDAFWAAIVAHFPEVETGDMDPITQVRYQYAMQEVVRAWLSFNHPALADHDA